MKTEIVYTEAGTGRFYRATVVTLDHALPREKRVKLPTPVVFVPAHVEPPGTRTYLSLSGGGMSSRKVGARKIPDAVRCGSDRYFFERGTCRWVRVIPDDYTERLHDLDERIAGLERERRELAEDAYAHGRPLRVDDVESESADYRSECARLEAERQAKVNAEKR